MESKKTVFVNFIHTCYFSTRKSQWLSRNYLRQSAWPSCAQGLIMPINLNLLPDTLLSWSVETKHYSNCVACHLHHALVNFVLKGQVLARHSGMCLKSQLLGRLRQEDLKFKTSLGNLVRPFLKLEHRKGWGCSSMGEHIPSMPWVPSSAPTKRRRRRRRKKKICIPLL